MRKTILLTATLLFCCSAAFLSAQDPRSGVSALGTLTSMPPDAPILVSPTNGTTNVLSNTLSWEALDHAASYNLQVSTESNFNTTIADKAALTATSKYVTELGGGPTYFWRVSATNVAGTGAYSATWEFSTDASLPVTFSLFSAEAVPEGVCLTWVTESEINNLGFILERSEASQTDWQCAATYRTHDALKGQGNTSSQTVYAYTDTDAQSGQSLRYRLSSVDMSGEVHLCDLLVVFVPEAPEATELLAPYPNPFNPSTKINYTLAETGQVELSVYDIHGRKVQTLFSGHQRAGSYNYYWHGAANTGTYAASGTYLIILRAPGITRTQKALFLR